MEYIEPVKENEFNFKLIPRSDLKLSPYQREFSGTLVNRLVNSVDQGFIIPLIVIEISHGLYEIIDGQHRLGALDKSSAKDDPEIPCIVLPSGYKDLPLFYNIEKTDNIKDKATKIHSLYLDKLDNSSTTETSIMKAINYEPYLFTIAFSYMEYELKSPSLIESPVKKLDKDVLYHLEGGYRVSLSLEEAIEYRRTYARLAAQLEETVSDVANDNDIRDFNLKKSIVSQSSKQLWGNARKLSDGPQSGLENLIEQINMMDWSWLGNK